MGFSPGAARIHHLWNRSKSESNNSPLDIQKN